MTWLDVLSKSLIAKAYRAGSEFAWPRNEALTVIEILTINGFTILGVDIWLATVPGPTIPSMYVYDWSIQQLQARGTAEQFVLDFNWDPADKEFLGVEPYFNITVDDRSSGPRS